MSEFKKSREQAKKILENYSKIPKNITVLEKRIFTLTLEEVEISEEEINEENYPQLEAEYKEILFQVCYMFSNGGKIKKILSLLKEGKINYNHEDFDMTRNKQKEYDDYLNNPFQLKKGLLPCEKCKSDRTMSSFKQDRGGDEGTSVYSQCLDCKHKWRVNN